MPDERATVGRVGEVEIAPHRDAYLVSMRLSSPAPDAEWLRLFNHPTGLELSYLVRKATVAGDLVEIVVQNMEQMYASVEYTERAIAQANTAYNDDVLPRPNASGAPATP